MLLSLKSAQDDRCLFRKVPSKLSGVTGAPPPPNSVSEDKFELCALEKEPSDGAGEGLLSQLFGIFEANGGKPWSAIAAAAGEDAMPCCRAEIAHW